MSEIFLFIVSYVYIFVLDVVFANVQNCFKVFCVHTSCILYIKRSTLC